jgi:hypothetical protein
MAGQQIYSCVKDYITGAWPGAGDHRELSGVRLIRRGVWQRPLRVGTWVVRARRKRVSPSVLRRAAAFAAAGLAAVSCGSVRAGHHATGTEPGIPASASGWHVIRGAPMRSVIVIAPGDTFAPPPAWAKPKLSGVQAWDKSFLGGGQSPPRPIPSDISYQLGLLTVPPSVTDVLAWGYSSPPGPCPPPIGAVSTAPPTAAATPSPSGRCVQWTFINANDASNPDGTWQRPDTPSPSPSPTPVTAIALRSGGFVSSDLERFSPQRLVLQGPLSTIRWTFRATTCSIDLYWFMPPRLQRGPARGPCQWQHRFSLNVVTNFASRGHVFSVIGGYVAKGEGQLVRAVLADGRTWIYDVQNGAWLFAVQRCGDFPGTAFRAVEELNQARHVIARLPVLAAPHLPSPGSCAS